METIEARAERRDKARSHVQFGQLLFKSGRLSKAIAHFESAVALNPENARAHYELAEALHQVEEPARAAVHYERVLELKPTCVEAATNLAVAYLGAERAEEAVRMSRHAIELDRLRAEKSAGAAVGSGGGRGGAGTSASTSPPAAAVVNSEAHYNLNAALRACGRAEEAYECTWQAIEGSGGSCCGPLPIPPTPSVQPASSTLSMLEGWLGRKAVPKLTVVCVKWGSKYDANYVNKLHAGVLAHFSGPFDFVCYTDDPSGLGAAVTAQLLDDLPGWDGWWLKAALFGPKGVRAGRVVYLDLDTIVVGSLDALFAFEGSFATLAADEWTCERDNHAGVNSSVMLWDAATCYTALAPVYEGLLDGRVFRHLMRFDHWLEMLLPPRRPVGTPVDATHPLGKWLESVQALFPGQLVEYKSSSCAEGVVPEGVAIICFPRSPKPHEVTDEWAQKAWHEL